MSSPIITNHPVEKPLNEKQQRFVSEYLQDSSSITKAAIRAGYSIHTAQEQGSRLLQDPRVQRIINDARQQAVENLGISAERVIQELWKVAGANPGDVITMTPDGDLDIREGAAGELSVTTVSNGDKKSKQVTQKTVKPADKIAALSQLVKIMQLVPEKEKEVKVNVSLVDLVEASLAEAPPRNLEYNPESDEEAA